MLIISAYYNKTLVKYAINSYEITSYFPKELL